MPEICAFAGSFYNSDWSQTKDVVVLLLSCYHVFRKKSAQTALWQPLGLCAFDFINQYSV